MAKFKVDTSTIKIGERLYRAANIAFIEQGRYKGETVDRYTINFIESVTGAGRDITIFHWDSGYDDLQALFEEYATNG